MQTVRMQGKGFSKGEQLHEKENMMISASQEAKRSHIPVAHIHTSSASALKTLLSERFGRL